MNKLKMYKHNSNILNRYLKSLLAMIFIVYAVESFAQDKYRTTAGTLIIKGEQGGKSVKVSSKKLLILLDYETGKLIMKQKVSDLISDNNIIQIWLNKHRDELITFEGKLGIDYINTKGHPPLDFPIEGLLSPDEKKIMGNGHLVHRVEKTSSSCLLSMTFNMEVDDVFPNIDLKNVNNNFQVEIVQSLLARVTER